MSRIKLCGVCGALPGKPCLTTKGREREDHIGRDPDEVGYAERERSYNRSYYHRVTKIRRSEVEVE